MEKATIEQILKLPDCPAFSVKDGVITASNHLAQQRLFLPGMEIGQFLKQSDFPGKPEAVILHTEGGDFAAGVTQLEDQQIFRLVDTNPSPELQAMALVAEVLRDPLSGIMPIADRMLSEQGESADLREINKGLYEILRMCNYMSRSTQGTHAPDEIRNLTSFFDETCEKAAHLLGSSGYTLEYSGPSQPVFGLANTDLLEQAVYSLLSNAAKFSPAGGKITASLTKSGDQLHFCVTDTGTGVGPAVQGKVFTMYQREAQIEDGRHGLGLGLLLARQAAIAHNGTILMDRLEQETRVTMVIQIHNPKNIPLKSKPMIVDTTGGWDPALVGLADVLNGSAFGK